MLCHFSTFYLMRKLNIFNLQVSFAKFCFGYKFSDLTFISVGFPFSSSLSCFDALIESVKFSCLSCICLKKKKSLTACWIKNQNVRIKELPAELGDYLQILLEQEFPNPRLFPGMSVWAMGGGWPTTQRSIWLSSIGLGEDGWKFHQSQLSKRHLNPTWHL